MLYSKEIIEFLENSVINYYKININFFNVTSLPPTEFKFFKIIFAAGVILRVFTQEANKCR